MSSDPETLIVEANDGYESYYAEKLWHWIPEIYRTLDAEHPSLGALRAIIEIVAAEAATLRRDVDRVWDDQSIELCDDWAISYLGELVGAVPVSGFNERGNRLAAARAVYYQRRNGTPQLLQELIRDIAGLEGVVVEAFRRLVRFPHRLDIDSIGEGIVTGTPVGGLVDLRNPRVHGLHDSGFDESAHFPDIRRLKGPFGRYGLSKVNFHLFPLRSFPLNLQTPFEIASGRHTLNPSGRDAPLYQRGQTSQRAPDDIRETDLPDEILCRRFNASQHEITPEALAVINSPALDTALAPLVGVRFKDTASFRELVSARLTAGQISTFMGTLINATTIDRSPKTDLWTDSVDLCVGVESSADSLTPSAVIAADLENWESGLTFEDYVVVAFDPARGRVIGGPDRGDDPLFAKLIHYGQFSSVGAGGYVRASLANAPSPDFEVPAGSIGVGGGFSDPGPVTGFSLPSPLVGSVRFTTSRTYEPDLPVGRVFGGITTTRLDASDETCPYVRFRPGSANLDITFQAAAAVPDEERVLVIDGLWLGLLASTFSTQDVADGDTLATPVEARIILDGNFDRVTLNHVTLDPGGEMARNMPDQVVAVPYVNLQIDGQVDLLEINQSITGPITENLANPDLCNAGEIRLCDSIVLSIDPDVPALQTQLGHIHMDRTTVIGNVEVARLYASDSIVDGRIRVTDNQNGCFRYSATGDYVGEPEGEARLPRRFEALITTGRLPVHWMVSRRFADPWFAALSKTAPEILTKGASNQAEMGAFNTRGLSILLDDLAAQVVRYLPVGLTPQYLINFREEK